MNPSKENATTSNPEHDISFDRSVSEEVIDNIESSSGIGAWDWNIKTNLIFWTRETYRIFGREPGTPLSVALIKQWIYPEDREDWEQDFMKCLNGLGPHRLSYRVLLKNGAYRWVRAQGNLIKSESGEPLRLCGHVIDETDLHQREQALVDIEKKMSQFEAVAKIGRWEWDILEDKVTWSREIFRFFEREPSEGAPPVAEQHRLFPRDEFERLSTALNRAVKYKESYAIKLKRIARDGTTRVCLARGKTIQNKQGKVVRLWGYLEDVTELEVIDQERELLRTAIEQSAEMILITDAQEKIIYANPALLKTTGYSLEELRGQTPRLFRSGMHSREFYEMMWDTLSRGNTWRGRIINRHKDDGLYTEEATITPVLDSAGHITHYIALKQDITETIHQQKQIEESQKLESIGRLAGGVAHDFNNMLQIIIGQVEYAQKSSSPDNPLLSSLQSIKEVARRSGNLTAQLLAFAREQAAMPVVICVQDKLKVLLELLRRLLGENIEVRVCMEEEPLYIRIDPVQFDQIITNLCVNARDAIADKGCICLSVEAIQSGRSMQVIHPEMKAGEYVQVKVSDNGSGIPPEVIEHIFEPFFTTKAKDEGTGLGLCTVHGIVKQNKGHVFVESECGHGTTFQLYFPRTEEAECVEAAANEVKYTEVRLKGTVMIVEDESMILELNAACLKDMGMDVIPAGDPEEALRLAQTAGTHIDVLMTDVVMPHLNGHELAEKIKELHPEIKVLYMSGYPADVVTRKGLLPPNVDFLRKPYSMDDLAHKFQEIL